MMTLKGLDEAGLVAGSAIGIIGGLIVATGFNHHLSERVRTRALIVGGVVTLVAVVLLAVAGLLSV